MRLKQDTEIQGTPCAKGYAWLYADGKLENCAVSKEVAFGEAKLPVGSILALEWTGAPKYAMMQHDSEVAGVKCSGGNWLLGPSEGAMVVLYPSGKLEQCWLAGDQVVQGPMYDRGIHRIIRRRCSARRRGKVLRERKTPVMHAGEGLWREAARRAVYAGAVNASPARGDSIIGTRGVAWALG
jgi:hypothetical protein